MIDTTATHVVYDGYINFTYNGMNNSNTTSLGPNVVWRRTFKLKHVTIKYPEGVDIATSAVFSTYKYP